MDRRNISVYTDGSCDGNPGPAGFAALIKTGRRTREVVGSVPYSTNNRMELQAVIAGLSTVRPGSHVTVHSDSLYVVDGFNSGRLKLWQANGWRRIRTLEPVKNGDLWRYLLNLLEERNLDVTFQKIAAHTGNRFNERVDFLARKAAKTA